MGWMFDIVYGSFVLIVISSLYNFDLKKRIFTLTDVYIFSLVIPVTAYCRLTGSSDMLNGMHSLNLENCLRLRIFFLFF